MFVSPMLTQDTRSARVIASLDNKNLSWRPGSFVTAEIEIAREPAHVMVPRAASRRSGASGSLLCGCRIAFSRDVKVG